MSKRINYNIYLKNINFLNNQNYIIGDNLKISSINNLDNQKGAAFTMLFLFLIIPLIFSLFISLIFNMDFIALYFLFFLGSMFIFAILPKKIKDKLIMLSNKIFLIKKSNIFLLKPGKNRSNILVSNEKYIGKIKRRGYR